MSKSEEMLQRLKEHLEKMTPEELEAQFDKITHKKFYSRWIDKIHNLSKEERRKWIITVYNKYNSFEYRDREYKLGYEPREELYWMLYEYARVHGIDYYDDFQGFFTTERYIVDGEFVVERIDGQGSVILVFNMEGYEENKNRLIKYMQEEKDKEC